MQIDALLFYSQCPPLSERCLRGDRQWKTNKRIQKENDKTQGFRRGKGSGSVDNCTKLTTLDYVNGDDMRHCGGPGLRWVNKVGVL